MAVRSWLDRTLRAPSSRLVSSLDRRAFGDMAPSSPLSWRRWTSGEKERVRHQLEAIKGQFTEDEAVLLHEWLVHEYMLENSDVLRSQADYDKLIERFRAHIRRRREMTPEEQVAADKRAEADVSPEFKEWLEDRLSRVGTRTVGNPGAWNSSFMTPTGEDEDGFAVFRHAFDLDLRRGRTTALVETTARECWPRTMAYVHNPVESPDLEELDVIRMHWRTCGAQYHVSRIAIEAALLSGRITREDIPRPRQDREAYERALNALVGELEARWPDSTARPRSLRPT